MVLAKLADIMEKKDISDAYLADKILMSTRSIENAKKCRGISRNTGKRIAAGLGMKLEDLL